MPEFAVLSRHFKTQLANCALYCISTFTNTNHRIHSATQNLMLSCPPRAHARALPRAHSTTRHDITCTPRRKHTTSKHLDFNQQANEVSETHSVSQLNTLPRLTLRVFGLAILGLTTISSDVPLCTDCPCTPCQCLLKNTRKRSKAREQILKRSKTLEANPINDTPYR